MNPDEVERHLMDGSRAAKLALIAAKEQARDTQVEIAGGLFLEEPGSPGRPQRWNPNKPITFGRMEEYWFELYIDLTPPPPSSVIIPYSLIKETWVNSVGRVTLLLAVQIVARILGTNRVHHFELKPYGG
jgi:hypothetical protein